MLIFWESQRINSPSVTAHLGVLRESCCEAASTLGLDSDVDADVLVKGSFGSLVSIGTQAGDNAIHPSDLSGGGALELPRDHLLLLTLLYVSAVFSKTFRLAEEPQIQFCDSEGNLLLDGERRWEEIAEVLRDGCVDDALIKEYRLGIAISLGLAGKPLDIRSNRVPDAFF